ncbi:hypothetical protein N0V90_012733 [Kalmusia sp. IMI 367209]|nr:hypothetical protein N0V90_012733 [Kalmusia sp. IMI 367209]
MTEPLQSTEPSSEASEVSTVPKYSLGRADFRKTGVIPDNLQNEIKEIEDTDDKDQILEKGGYLMDSEYVRYWANADTFKILALRLGSEPPESTISKFAINELIQRSRDEADKTIMLYFIYPEQRVEDTAADYYVHRSLIQQLLPHIECEVPKQDGESYIMMLEKLLLHLLDPEICKHNIIIAIHGFPAYEQDCPDEAHDLLQLFTSLYTMYENDAGHIKIILTQTSALSWDAVKEEKEYGVCIDKDTLQKTITIKK